MFNYEDGQLSDKGLFTFYRQQAQIQQKTSGQKRHLRHEQKYLQKYNHHQQKNKLDKKTSINLTQILPHKTYFSVMNKEHVNILSLKNQSTPQLTNKKLGVQVVVILKGNSNKSRQDLRLKKLNLSYSIQNRTNLRQQQDQSCQQQNPKSRKPVNQDLNVYEGAFKMKRNIKKQQNFNDRYLSCRGQLQSKLILSEQIKTSRQNPQPVKFQGLKKVNMLPLLPQINKPKSKNHNFHHSFVHKRNPPRMLASILKSQNYQMIKNLRKVIQKQKQQERLNKVSSQINHSFIQFRNYEDYDNSAVNINKLNQNQRRLIGILNKFSKRIDINQNKF